MVKLCDGRQTSPAAAHLPRPLAPHSLALLPSLSVCRHKSVFLPIPCARHFQQEQRSGRGCRWIPPGGGVLLGDCTLPLCQPPVRVWRLPALLATRVSRGCHDIILWVLRRQPRSVSYTDICCRARPAVKPRPSTSASTPGSAHPRPQPTAHRQGSKLSYPAATVLCPHGPRPTPPPPSTGRGEREREDREGVSPSSLCPPATSSQG